MYGIFLTLRKKCSVSTEQQLLNVIETSKQQSTTWTEKKKPENRGKQNLTKKHKVTLKQQFLIILIQLRWSFITRGQLKLAWLLLRLHQIVFIKQCLAAYTSQCLWGRECPATKLLPVWIVCLAATVEWLQPQINSYHLSSRLQFWPSLNSWTWASSYCTVLYI